MLKGEGADSLTEVKYQVQLEPAFGCFLHFIFFGVGPLHDPLGNGKDFCLWKFKKVH